MTSDLQASIESYLLEEPGTDGWFTERQIVERFKLESDRFLRATGEIPGPLSRITIFSGKGVKHLRRATKDEIQQCRDRLKREIASRANRDRWINEGIARVLDGDIEKHTGQKVTTT